MKLNDLRKIIREEVTKVVRKELVGFVKLLGEAQTAKPVKKKRTTKKNVVTETSLKDMMSEFEGENFPQEEQNFSNDPTLNSILNETANTNKPGQEPYPTMGNKVYDRSSMAEMLGYGDGVSSTLPAQNVPPMTTPDGAPVQQVPQDVAKAMTRNYGDLMQALDKKKQGSPLKG